MKKPTVLSAAIFAALLFAASAQAQVINWGTATTMAGDSDVANNGGAFDAATFFGTATTVNGVTFNPLNVSGSGGMTDASGDISIFYNGFPIAPTVGDPNDPNAYEPYTNGGSAAYQNVVSTLTFSQGGPGATGTVILSNLIVNHTYQVEVWAYDGKLNDSDSVATQLSGATAPNGLLNGTPSNSAPPVGQYLTGTFTPTFANTNSFTFVATQSFAVIDAVSVRDLTATPEPSAFWLSLIGIAALGIQIHRMRSARKTLAEQGRDA